MPMIVSEGSWIKDIKSFLLRVNKTNDLDLAWRWYGVEDDPLVEIFHSKDDRTFLIATPRMVIQSMKLHLNDKGLTNPDL